MLDKNVIIKSVAERCVLRLAEFGLADTPEVRELVGDYIQNALEQLQ